MNHLRSALAALLFAATACGGETTESHVPRAATPAPGPVHLVTDTTIVAVREAAGVVEPLQRSILSTRLMGSVEEVLVREGDPVRAGQPLVRIDARDLSARREQVTAAIEGAEAAQREATLQAQRMRNLFADSAASRAQLDAVESGLARAEASVRAARASEVELVVAADYAVIRAPFAGVVTQRLVDPGTMAAPGAPILAVEDQHQLRATASVPPVEARTLGRGSVIEVDIEGTRASGRVEGVVPANASGLASINVIVDNPRRVHLSGSVATLRIPLGTRKAILVPQEAIRRQGDLTSVQVVGGSNSGLRWVKVGDAFGSHVEVLSGLRAGERIAVSAGAPEA